MVAVSGVCRALGVGVRRLHPPARILADPRVRADQGHRRPARARPEGDGPGRALRPPHRDRPPPGQAHPRPQLQRRRREGHVRGPHRPQSRPVPEEERPAASRRESDGQGHPQGVHVASPPRGAGGHGRRLLLRPRRARGGRDVLGPLRRRHRRPRGHGRRQRLHHSPASAGPRQAPHHVPGLVLFRRHRQKGGQAQGAFQSGFLRQVQGCGPGDDHRQRRQGAFARIKGPWAGGLHLLPLSRPSRAKPT